MNHEDIEKTFTKKHKPINQTMKKILMGFAALSLLFGAVSCEKETRETAPDGKKELSFRAALGKQALSRAAEFTAWTAGDDLTVYAYKTGSTAPAYANPTFNLEYDGSVWSYGTPITSTGGNVWYYSWYPTASSGVSNNSVAVNSYSFDYSATHDEDLVAAGIPTSDYNVNLAFQHVLSQVNFALYTTEHLKITINSIALNGIKYTGTYTMGTGQGWSDVDGATNYSYELDGASNITDGTATSGTLVDLNDGSNALMLIPQTFADAANMVINFDLSRAGVSGDDVIVDGAEATVPLNNFEILEWLPGKRYVYQLDFSSYIQTGEIKFNVSVGPWVDDTNSSVATLEVADNNLASIENAIAKLSAANTANSDLAVFTVSVPVAIEAMTLATIPSFDAADEIVIEFADTTSAGNFNVTAEDWTSDVEGSTVTLTCTPA